VAKTRCTHHCSNCDSHFSSLAAFDLHRAGDFRTGQRHCLDPEDIKGRSPHTTLVAKSWDGYCDLRHGIALSGVAVWQLEVGAPWYRGGRPSVPKDAVGGSA
jgi:hypothetical protein